MKKRCLIFKKSRNFDEILKSTRSSDKVEPTIQLLEHLKVGKTNQETNEVKKSPGEVKKSPIILHSQQNGILFSETKNRNEAPEEMFENMPRHWISCPTIWSSSVIVGKCEVRRRRIKVLGRLVFCANGIFGNREMEIE